MKEKFPKVLLVTRNVWDDSAGTSSTDSNLFGNYNPEALSQIYIETRIPKTKYCFNFFQISEYSLIKRLFNKNIVTGRYINISNDTPVKQAMLLEKKEQKIMSFVRSNRSIVYTFAREILWLFNGWKSKELEQFIRVDKPDILFIYGSPLILMNRLQNYILKNTKRPAAYYFMDDVYTYKSIKGAGFAQYIYKYFLRIAVKRVVKQCQTFFVVSPKMKVEYDSIFNINSQILTKGIDYSTLTFKSKPLNNPLRIVYMGQIIYGRVYSLVTMANTLHKINENGVKAQLTIYTGNAISNQLKDNLVFHNTSQIMPLVPYDEIQQIMAQSDIVVFVESMNEKYKNIARLSFSTKLTDYFSAGKCIFAIGGSDIAPIEYLKEKDAAIVATSVSEIEEKLSHLINNQNIIKEYAMKSFHCGKQYHDLSKMNNLLYQNLASLNQESNNH